MGALKGSASYLRFLVDGDLPNNAGSLYEKSIESRRFLPLHPDGESNDAAGWVSFEAPFDDKASLRRDAFMMGDLIAITYREDKFAIPKPVLQRAVKDRLRKIVEEEKKDEAELSRAFIKVVEKAVLAELKHKTYPRSKLVDVIWDVRSKEARVFGRGTVVTERLASLFERTFQVRLELGSYAARAFTVDLPTRAQGVLEKLSPGWLFPDAILRDPSEPGSAARDEVTDAA